METTAVRRERNSSLELLKIIAMLAIVFSHVAQSLLLPEAAGTLAPGEFGTLSYCIDFSTASPDPTLWLLVCVRTLGAWGNTIFVICSSWFLCRDNTVKMNKVVYLVLNVFVISVLILLCALAFGLHPNFKVIVRCLFPTTFANNWFITCYLLLYAIHPAINWTTKKLGKRGHAALAIALFTLYMLLPLVHDGHFFTSELIVMISEYVVVSYARSYLPRLVDDARTSRRFFLVGSIAMILVIVLLEIAGLHVGFLKNKMLHFDKDGNPFLFLSAFGLFNLFRLRPFTSIRVNRMASLVLFVYLIHENLIVREYLRPTVWLWIHETLGYDSLVLWLVIFSAALFVAAFAFAFLYSLTLEKITARIEQPIEHAARHICSAAVDWLCSLS
ncbi:MULTISPECIES: acyltransferase [Atopobiaceae]|uniref:acyltransferase family protein n=1 Tax=Atopobiaceae TaxID=1643824 RepID=UPI0026F0DDBD|nr:acyltransferase [Parafannyhessea umbonata]MDD7199476.1 acyltransferase [Parafannyhessea umbonata]